MVDLSKEDTLASLEAGVDQERALAVDRMLRILHWADLHSGDPQAEAGAVPVKLGGARLVDIGGDGSPQVADSCFGELAVALRSSAFGVRLEMADALDLRHRLPNLFAATLALATPSWLARKIARLSRKLSSEAVELVDLAVSAAVEESPGRVLAIAEAKIIEADLEGYREKVRRDAARKGVWFHRKRPGGNLDELGGEADVRGATVRLSTAGAERYREMVECLAEALEGEFAPSDGEDPKTRDQFRAEAAELLADPHAAAAFLDGLADGGLPDTEPPELPDADQSDQPHPASGPARPARGTSRGGRRGTINVHLSAEVLCGLAPGVARVEGVGPMLLEHLAELLRHREITLQPVIDLNHVEAVNHYEHPTRIRRRARLRNAGDVFPHSSTSPTSRVDIDHPVPYDRDGPPGQTSDRNAAPLARYAHRLKTHEGFDLAQLGLGAYRWVTPHGLGRVVTPRGTQRVELLRAGGKVVGEIYSVMDRIASDT